MREGQNAWEEMLTIDRAKMSNNEWKLIPKLETKIKELEELKNNREIMRKELEALQFYERGIKYV